MAALVWLVIPVVAVVAAAIWGRWAGRRRVTGDGASLAGYERFRVAMEKAPPVADGTRTADDAAHDAAAGATAGTADDAPDDAAAAAAGESRKAGAKLTARIDARIDSRIAAGSDEEESPHGPVKGSVP